MRAPASARVVLSLLLAAALLGCGPSGASRPGSQPRSSADRIGEAELDPLYQLSAYEAVQRLRPRWLQTRTHGEPMVHVDGNVRDEGAEALRNLRSADVQEMQYMSPADATTRFGTGYVNGLILVTTKR